MSAPLTKETRAVWRECASRGDKAAPSVVLDLLGFVDGMEADFEAMTTVLRGRCWCCAKGFPDPVAGAVPVPKEERLGVFGPCKPETYRHSNTLKDCPDWSFDRDKCTRSYETEAKQAREGQKGGGK